MIGLHRLLLPLALLALVWLVPSAEAATIKAKTSVTTKSGATRIVAKLSSKRPLGARKRPRKVRVKGGGQTYRLKRVSGASAARVSLGTWRSGAYRGADAKKILDLVGERLKVVIRSRSGTTTVRSKLAPPPGATPAPDDGDQVPGGGDQPPGGGDLPPPGDGGSGDITGQQAIDQMTAEIRDGAVRRFQSSGGLSETFELHLCGDGQFRHYHHQSYVSGGDSTVLATETFGQPWTVVEALIKADATYRGARVQGTATFQRSYPNNEQGTPINEPAEALIEWQNGQWYWDKQPVETDTANCNPSF